MNTNDGSRGKRQRFERRQKGISKESKRKRKMENGRLRGEVGLFIGRRGTGNEGTRPFGLTNHKAPRVTFSRQNSFLCPSKGVNPEEQLIIDEKIPSLNILYSPTSNEVRGQLIRIFSSRPTRWMSPTHDGPQKTISPSGWDKVCPTKCWTS